MKKPKLIIGVLLILVALTVIMGLANLRRGKNASGLMTMGEPGAGKAATADERIAGERSDRKATGSRNGADLQNSADRRFYSEGPFQTVANWNHFQLQPFLCYLLNHPLFISLQSPFKHPLSPPLLLHYLSPLTTHFNIVPFY